MNRLDFYKGKNVLITGHTGFKGSWLCRILADAGAVVTGFSLEAPTEPNLFTLSGVEKEIHSVIGDVRDLKHLMQVFDEAQPEIVFHLAAQPIVRDSYKNPVYTYETNVMGTVNICECVRLHPCVKSFLNVTTDKVYENREWEWGYRENEPLDGFDPYSNSKSCSELVTHSYIRSFFDNTDTAVSTARAGNVIGGGDFANDRIIPDCVRAAISGQPIVVRNPYSTRPYQHVLEPLSVYLTIAQKQYEDKAYAGFYNVGPDDCDCVTTGELVDLFCECWNREEENGRQDGIQKNGSKIESYEDCAKIGRINSQLGQTPGNSDADPAINRNETGRNTLVWINRSETNAPHEANFLKLDCSKIKRVFGWKPIWHIEDAVAKTVEWSKIWAAGGDVTAVMKKQIGEFFC